MRNINNIHIYFSAPRWERIW